MTKDAKFKEKPSELEYLAHIAEDGQRQQKLREHLFAVGEMAGKFAEDFDAGESGRVCGLAHDLGKYSKEFQKRIRGGRQRVDHSTAGGKELIEAKNVPAAFAVFGHHGGLPDMGSSIDTAQEGSFFGKMKRNVGEEIRDYYAYEKEIKIPKATIPNFAIENNESSFFFTKLLYSALVDADYRDTEAFMSNGKVVRGGYKTLKEL